MVAPLRFLHVLCSITPHPTTIAAGGYGSGDSLDLTKIIRLDIAVENPVKHEDHETHCADLQETIIGFERCGL